MKKLLVLLLVFAVAMFVMACEDALEMPAAPEPAPVVDYLAMVENITEEWATTAKVFSMPYPGARGPEAGNCATCHDGAVFASKDFKEGVPLTGIDCQACHTGTGIELMESGLVTVPFASEKLDAGKAALCVYCHHGRRDPVGALATYGDTPESSRYTYPHYAPAAIVTGMGGMQYPDVEYASSRAHANIEDSCITCHMPETSDGYMLHSFVLKAEDAEASCGSCHTGITDFNLNGFQDKVKDALDKVYAAILVDTGAVSLTSGGGTFIYTATDGTVLNRAQVSEAAYVASYNWYLIKTDGSYGVHNPRYTKALLNESYKTLTGNDLGL